MSTLKLFRSTSRLEQYGDSLRPQEAWSLVGILDPSEFFRALPSLLPAGSIIYLESVGSDAGIALARRYVIEPEPDWAAIRPATNFFHLRLTPEMANELADFAEHHALPELACHIHAYFGDQVMLEWHDAFGQPLRLSRLIPETKVRLFCDLLNCDYGSEFE